MLTWLNNHPYLLMVLNCCIGPVAFMFLGAMIARYKPRFRLPFTIDRYDDDPGGGQF